ncbi:MAG: hypothetical protein ACPKM0_03885 [Pleomorphochaeta sp.]
MLAAAILAFLVFDIFNGFEVTVKDYKLKNLSVLYLEVLSTCCVCYYIYTFL